MKLSIGNPRRFKALSLLFIFISSCLSPGFGQDLLDSVQDQSKDIVDLKDVYRAFKINHKIADQGETINLFIGEASEEELNSLLDQAIRECGALKTIRFNNDSLHFYIEKYVTSTLHIYQVARSKGVSSDAFKESLEAAAKDREKYMDYLAQTYPTSRFVKMTEEKYWETIDKKRYIKSPGYAAYKALLAKDPKAAVAALDKLLTQTTDLREYSIYQIESADQYVKHADLWDETGDETAIRKYKEILDQGQYHLYLFEAWLKWRTVTQQNNGLSKSSEIPNDTYDRLREKLALVILAHIAKHHDDEMAINEFTQIATHDIVRRFGAYPYGNQNTVEYHSLFDEKE